MDEGTTNAQHDLSLPVVSPFENNNFNLLNNFLKDCPPPKVVGQDKYLAELEQSIEFAHEQGRHFSILVSPSTIQEIVAHCSRLYDEHGIPPLVLALNTSHPHIFFGTHKFGHMDETTRRNLGEMSDHPVFPVVEVHHDTFFNFAKFWREASSIFDREIPPDLVCDYSFEYGGRTESSLGIASSMQARQIQIADNPLLHIGHDIVPPNGYVEEIWPLTIGEIIGNDRIKLVHPIMREGLQIRTFVRK